MIKDDPKHYIAMLSKRARCGRVLVDYFRNGRGRSLFDSRAKGGVGVDAAHLGGTVAGRTCRSFPRRQPAPVAALPGERSVAGILRPAPAHRCAAEKVLRKAGVGLRRSHD